MHLDQLKRRCILKLIHLGGRRGADIALSRHSIARFMRGIGKAPCKAKKQYLAVLQKHPVVPGSVGKPCNAVCPIF